MPVCQDTLETLSRNLRELDVLLAVHLLVRLFCHAEFESTQHNMEF
jgi:hypothetical protein